MSTDDRALFDQIYPKARRYAAFVAPTGIDPDDLVQEALTRVLRRGPLNLLDEPVAYLRVTILNLVRSQIQRDERERRALDRLTNSSVESLDDLSGSAREVLEMLRKLPPQTAAAVFLTDVEGLSIADTAKQIGLSTMATRARLSRARRLLRDQLSATEEIAG